MKTCPCKAHCLPLLTLLSALLLTGCIHLEQKIQINADGSVAVFYHYSVAEQDLPTLLAARRTVDEWQGSEVDGGGPHWFTNRKAVEEHFSANGADVQVYRRYTRLGRMHVEITVFADDAMDSLNSGLFGTFELLETPDGNFLFRATPPVLTQDAAADDVVSTIKALADDLRITFSVQAPKPIVSSTAHRVEGRTAMWVFDARKNDAFLRQIPPVHIIYQGKRRVE